MSTNQPEHRSENVPCQRQRHRNTIGSTRNFVIVSHPCTMTMMMMMIKSLLTSLCLVPFVTATTTLYTRGAAPTKNEEGQSSSTKTECGFSCCPECDRIHHLPGYDAPL